MNTLEACTIDTPFSEMDECSKFTIEDVLTPFTLHNVFGNGDRYTMSLWVKTILDDEITPVNTDEEEDVEEPDVDTGMSLLIRGANMPVTSKWTYYSHTFPTFSSDLNIFFNAVGTYYIYHPQLERGNAATDWSESPIDTAERIKAAKDAADKANSGVEALYIKLEDSIQAVVSAINSGTMLEQTENGWNFIESTTTKDLAAVSQALKDLKEKELAELAGKIAENSNLSTYVQVGDYIDPETGEKHPKIEMGIYEYDELTNTGSFGEFTLRIIDTELQFLQWGEPIAWLSNQELHIRKAVIEDELAVGGFVLKKHGTNGNVGFLWKGVTG